MHLSVYNSCGNRMNINWFNCNNTDHVCHRTIGIRLVLWYIECFTWGFVTTRHFYHFTLSLFPCPSQTSSLSHSHPFSYSLPLPRSQLYLPFWPRTLSVSDSNNNVSLISTMHSHMSQKIIFDVGLNRSKNYFWWLKNS